MIQILGAEMEVVGVGGAVIEFEEPVRGPEVFGGSEGLLGRMFGVEQTFPPVALAGDSEHVIRAPFLPPVSRVLRPHVRKSVELDVHGHGSSLERRHEHDDVEGRDAGGVTDRRRGGDGHCEPGLSSAGYDREWNFSRIPRRLDLGFLPLVRFQVFVPNLAHDSHRLARKANAIRSSGDQVAAERFQELGADPPEAVRELCKPWQY